MTRCGPLMITLHYLLMFLYILHSVVFVYFYSHKLLYLWFFFYAFFSCLLKYYWLSRQLLSSSLSTFHIWSKIDRYPSNRVMLVYIDYFAIIFMNLCLFCLNFTFFENYKSPRSLKKEVAISQGSLLSVRSREFTKIFGRSRQARPVLNHFTTEWAALRYTELRTLFRKHVWILFLQSVSSLVMGNL